MRYLIEIVAGKRAPTAPALPMNGTPISEFHALSLALGLALTFVDL
jgi:hypothetical protein